jgi:hypothetical protein
VVEIISAALEIQTGMGSFDSVRLAPHFAQDDKELKFKTTEDQNLFKMAEDQNFLKMTDD